MKENEGEGGRERDRNRAGDFAFRRGTLFTSACEFALRKGLQVMPARARRGALTRLQKMSTLSLRGCALSPAARKQANTRSRARTRANAYAPRASLYAPALKVAILNSLSNDTTGRKEEKEEAMEERERERDTLRLVAPACGNTRKPITQPAPGSLETDSLHAIPCKRGAPLRAA